MKVQIPGTVASQPRDARRATVLRTLAALSSVATLVLLAVVGMHSYYGTDEFNYAHAAWAIAQGQQPYRDFFLHHFPGSMQLGSVVFAMWDDPRAMVGLRWLMVPFWLAAAVAITLLNRRYGPWPALLSVPLLGSLAAWVRYATQFRPDPIAISLFLLSLLLATDTGPRARRWAFLAGICFVWAGWSSQKVVIYGVPLLVAWLAASALARVAPRAPRPMNAPAQFGLGLIAGAVPIAVYLTATDNWSHWWAWCLYGGIVHETMYPERSPLISLLPTLRANWYVLGLALLGAGLVLRRLSKRPVGVALADPDALVLACAITTAVSYLMQQAPYGWSLVAPLAFVALLAARGLGELLQRALPFLDARCMRDGLVVACIVIAFAGVPFSVHSMMRTTGQRARQESMLATVARLSAPSDPVYDNTGYYVARPHAYFFFWTDQSARLVHRDRMIREVPDAILDGGVTMRIRDRRDRELPPVLRSFLGDHFVCVAGDVCLWGRTYAALGAGQASDFLAVRSADYYVSPASAAASGALRIDGLPVRSAVFSLERGRHVVTWAGPTPVPEFSIVWLPRTGETLAPEARTIAQFGIYSLPRSDLASHW
ncbi:MAG TPA: hypothetical protein VMY76_08495 [Gemmatimonadales bacterium]|nr:hypothetical protein [Gemmatimonadales bacterium]